MVWVSATTGSRTGASRLIYDAWLQGALVIVTSQTLVNEVAETLVEYLQRPTDEVERLVALIEVRADWYAIKHQVMGCQDLDDDPVLETALVGEAEYIVTRDPHLLKLPRHVAQYYRQRGVTILTPHEFAPILHAAQAAAGGSCEPG